MWGEAARSSSGGWGAWRAAIGNNGCGGDGGWCISGFALNAPYGAKRWLLVHRLRDTLIHAGEYGRVRKGEDQATRIPTHNLLRLVDTLYKSILSSLMHSPKFELIIKELSPIFTESRLKHVWKKVRYAVRRFPLRDAIDHFDFEIELEARIRHLSRNVKEGQYAPKGQNRYRVEKSKGLCRQLVMPTVQDCIVLQILSDCLYHEITKTAPSAKAYFKPEDGNFNKKFELLAAEQYGSRKAWLDFQNKLFGFPINYKFLVITDIANYYDFVKYSHLRNVISPKTDKAECILDLLIFVLSGLSWSPDYMPTQLTGLPQIDIDAPRLLAHALLFEIDNHIEHTAKMDHVRFMDDIDVGANSISEAKKILRDIDLILQTRQLRLNSGKTKILTAKDAEKHLCIKENYILTVWQQQMDKDIAHGKNTKRHAERVVKIVSRGLSEGFFDRGNGEKILKRLITTANKLGAELRLDDIIRIIRLRPGVRANAFWHLSKRRLGMRELRPLRDLVLDEVFVDDDAFMQLTKLLTEASVVKSKPVQNTIRDICKYLFDKSGFGVVLAQRIAGRFLTRNEVLHYTGAKRTLWEHNYVMGRYIAAHYPTMMKSPTYLAKFKASLEASKNDGCATVQEFYENLVFQKPDKKIKYYCRAPNPTLPLGANFEKVMMLVALVQNNTELSKADKDALMANHTKLVSDPYYGPLLKY
ncbi:MAG: hypothetical protein GVY06_03380 [Alphaproteobacteria bacterium]|jgi:hypothetical protein|nr:hypothetical protein [Alphaproteobacteria bacterium]